MKTNKIYLLIFVLFLLTGCNTPRTIKDVPKKEEVDITQEPAIKNETDKKDDSKNNKIELNNKHAKPNGEYIILRIGKYIVGKDIKPGRYYIYTEELHAPELTRLTIYDENDNPQDLILPSLNAPSAMFSDGNKVEVNTGTILLMPEYIPIEDLYEIEKPEGTLVSAGLYLIGYDIPAGSYKIYPESFATSECVFYFTQEAYSNNDSSLSKRIEVDYSYEKYGQIINLYNDSVLNIISPLIMQKVDLNFD